ncbi:HlyD family secretion protein [Sphingobium yanoikuyae]|uniref:HlyD family efflux transporter periplasmic adaptor subunit n=1 Tax=Sphingobium yanoikuyae TaxID=13690 RepID=A0A9X7UEB0_SPHYA|nr:HlyD family efflux transporter periplasmic adaptor subunit [Sphingobium yanoikuyae]QNG47729.1 HlyD family efflux transporter periplasmic adaptor subunit [Sphingobium yanoikuyae]
MTFFAIAGVWSYFTPFPTRVSGRGFVVRGLSPLVIKSPKNGIITSSNFNEGDFIDKGDLIAEIDTAGVNPEYRYALRSLLDRQADSASDQYNLELEIQPINRKKMIRDREIALQQLSDAHNQLQIQEILVESAKASFKQIEEVARRGFISKTETERRYQEVLVKQQNLSALRAKLAEARAKVDEIDTQIAREPVEAKQRERLASAAKDAADERVKTLDAQSRYQIRAQASGYAAGWNAHVGRIVREDATLGSIIDNGHTLSIEAYFPANQRGKLQVGNRAILRFDAYPYQQYGQIPAIVAQVALSSVAPDQTLGPLALEGPVIRVLLTPARGATLPKDLGPNMTANVDVVSKQTTVFDKLTDNFRVK